MTNANVSETTSQEDTPLNRLRRWQHGETLGPWYVIFFPTNRCNLNCVMCWRRKMSFDPHDEIPDERLLTMVDECAELGAREWCIVGGGEPLIRAPLVMKICTRIRDKNMSGTLQHNATLLKPDHMRALIEVGWNYITCSLDGPTAEINDFLRGEGTFDRATAAMAQCAAMRHEMNAAAPHLVLYATLTRHNYDVLPGMVELASRLGCNSVQAGLATGEWCEDHLLTPAQHKALPEIVARGKQRGVELGICTDFASVVARPGFTKLREVLLRRIFGNPRGISGALCFDPWYSLAILADGRMGPCCSSWKTEAPKISDGPLQDIWLGPYFTEARQRIAEGKALDFCRYCPPILAQRGAITRRLMQFSDYTEDWSDLKAYQKVVLYSWESSAKMRQKIREYRARFRKPR